MIFIDEHYKPIHNLRNNGNKLLWLYDLEREDFYLRRYQAWFCIKSDAYKIKINDSEIIIPSNFSLIIGDYDAGLDCVSPSEIVGREFEALTFGSQFESESWLLEKIEVSGYVEEQEFLIPFTKHLMPIKINSKKSLLISQFDVYNKVKQLTFSDIV